MDGRALGSTLESSAGYEGVGTVHEAGGPKLQARLGPTASGKRVACLPPYFGFYLGSPRRDAPRLRLGYVSRKHGGSCAQSKLNITPIFPCILHDIRTIFELDGRAGSCEVCTDVVQARP